MPYPRTSQKTVNEVKPWLVLAATCLGAFLVALDVTVVNVALPSIQREFNVGLVDTSWIINAYTLTFAALVIIGGKFGDIFGRKRLLLIGLLVFALGSLLGGLAPNVHFLQAARVIQGIGSAMMMPGALSILTEAFQRRDLSLAIGIWGGVGALGFILGPVIGGTFTSLFSWRAIFFLNLPIVVVTMVFAFRVVRESWDRTIDRSIDYLGVAISAGAVFLLVLATVWGNTYGWSSPLIVALFLAAGLLIILFALVEMRAKSPIVDPSFFRHRAFAVGASVRFAAGFAFLPVIFMSVIYLQTFLHKGAFEAGLMLLPAGVTIVVSTVFWGKVAEHYGPRIPMVVGMGVSGIAALLWLRFDAGSGYVDLLPSLILASFGGAAAFVTTTVVIMYCLGVDKAGVASGIVNMMQNVSASLGIASVSAIFLASLRSELAQAAPGVDYQQVQAFGPAVGDVAQAGAFANALSNGAIIVMVVLFVGAAIALLLPKDTAHSQG